MKHVLAATIGAATLSAATLGIAATMPAVAQQAAPVAPDGAPINDAPMPRHGGAMRGRGLLRADANGDGVVTRDEAIADADRRFAARDRDGNGRIDRDERRSGRRPDQAGAQGDAPRLAERASAAAAGDDRAGRAGPPVTREQARERMLRMFDRADTDHDGRVDQRELAAMRLLMRARALPPGDERP